MTTLSINTVPREIFEREGNTRLPNRTRGQLLNREEQFATVLHHSLEDIGERFGLYDIMAHSGPITPACLATQAGVPEPPMRIWLEAQASGKYLHHQARTNLYCLWCAWSPGRGGRSP